MTIQTINRYHRTINDIANLNWSVLTRTDLTAVAAAYYYFSVQFREALEVACDLYPSDHNLVELRSGECDTDNLSPCHNIALDGEKMNHDEFMRRVVDMAPLDPVERDRIEQLGRSYLAESRAMDALTRAMSLSSYEDGGLEKVFDAILRAPDWDEPSLCAFRHFLIEHIRLDGNEHGSLCRHLVADDRVLPLWIAFRNILVKAAPRLAGGDRP